MTPREFTFWIAGFINTRTKLDGEDLDAIRATLNKVEEPKMEAGYVTNTTAGTKIVLHD